MSERGTAWCRLVRKTTNERKLHPALKRAAAVHTRYRVVCSSYVAVGVVGRYRVPISPAAPSRYRVLGLSDW